MDFLWFIVAGGLAGVISGLLGLGGGTVIVPALSFIFAKHMHVPQDMVMHMAMGTSLCIMIFTSQASVWSHIGRSYRAWPFFKRLLPFLMLGTVMGGVLADALSMHALKRLFGCFLLVMALQPLLRISKQPKKWVLPLWVHQLVSVGIGCCSGLLGIGGGALIIPYLSHCRIHLRKIISIAALCSLSASVCGTATVIFTGFNNSYHMPWSLGYVYWPAVILAALPSIVFARLAVGWAYGLPLAHLKLFFSLFLFATGLRMFW